MTVRIEARLHDDTLAFTSYMHAPPRKGEYLWVTGLGGEGVHKRHGTTAFRVQSVCHWVAADFVPHNDEVIHRIAVYVRPVINEAADEN